ncbi:MAG TPA: MarR family transcriptional regulator [Candidatus Saccharimonadales bacterium]|nr:MarR family transcriptional regulator [Candidatus Saccharimonadales bacterium]
MASPVATKFFEVMFKNSRLLRDRVNYSSELTQLSMLQVQTLSLLKRNGSVQMREIADYFHIELPSATSLLNKLVSLQLVERQQDAKDRRLVKVTLTKAGDDLLKKSMDVKLEHLEHMLSYLTEEEQRELLRLVEKLNDRIEENN